MSNWDDNVHRINTIVGRGYLAKDVDTSKMMPRAKVVTAKGQVVENIDFITPAGIGSNPTSGNKTEIITFDPNGDPSQRVAMPIGDRKNFRKGKPGSTWIQSPDNPDQFIEASKDGLALSAKDKPVTIKSKEFNQESEKASLFGGKFKFDGNKIIIECDIEITGNVNINGQVAITGGLTVNGVPVP